MANKPATACLVPPTPNGGTPQVTARSLIQATSSRTTQPLIRGRTARTVKIDHEPFLATQYDFYIPVAVWYHSAVRLFIKRVSQIAGGATIFKGATGVWKRDPGPETPEGGDPGTDEEDVYIYRLVVRASEFNADASRPGLHTIIADMMASLSECSESIQQAFMFTETEIVMDLSRLILPARAGRLQTTEA